MKKYKNKQIWRLMMNWTNEHIVVCQYLYKTYRRYAPKQLFMKKHIKNIYVTEAAYERKQVKKIIKWKLQPKEERSLFSKIK